MPLFRLRPGRTPRACIAGTVLLALTGSLPAWVAAASGEISVPGAMAGEWVGPADGVLIRLRGAQPRWRTDDTAALLLDLKNNGKESFSYVGFGRLECRIAVDDVSYGYSFSFYSGPGNRLEPNQQQRGAIVVLLEDAMTADDPNAHPLNLRLSPGRHKVTVEFHGLISQPVEIDIFSPEDAGPAYPNNRVWGTSQGGKVRLRPLQSLWADGQAPGLTFALRNFDGTDLAGVQAEQACKLEIDGRSYHLLPGAPAVPATLLAAGRQSNGLAVTLDARWRTDEGGQPLSLAPGLHTVELTWTHAKSNPVEIEIRRPRSAADPAPPVTLAVDRAIGEMAEAVAALRQKYGLRICMVSLADENSPAKLSANQVYHQVASQHPQTYPFYEYALRNRAMEMTAGQFDLPPRSNAHITAPTVDALLDELTAGSPYAWRKIAGTYLILPDKLDPDLVAQITLKTGNLSVMQAVTQTLQQSPAARIVLAAAEPGPATPAWLSARLPELSFDQTPLLEALCQITAVAHPDSCWVIDGPKEKRVLRLFAAPGPNPAFLP